jgi:hypothetical protein
MEGHMNSYLSRIFIIITVTLSFLILPGLAGKALCQTDFGAIKSVMVLDFVDKTGKFDGKKVADMLRQDLAAQGPLKVIPKNQMLEKFKKLKVQRSKLSNPTYRKKVSKFFGVGGLVMGTITKEKNYKLELRIERIKTGTVIHHSSILFKKEVGPNASKIAVAKFLGITAPAPETGAQEGYAPIAPTPPPDIEPPMAQGEVPQRTMPEDQEMSTAPAPSAEPAKEEKETKSESYEGGEGKVDWLTLKVSPAFYKNSYSVKNPAGSAVVNVINIDTGLFPGVNFSGDLWFLKFLGIDFGFNYGSVKLTVTPPGGTAFNVNTTYMQFGGGVKYRYIFMDNPRSPYASARIGYGIQTFSPGTQASAVISKNTYKDLGFGIGIKCPFWFLEKPDLGLNFGFDYFIMSSLKETVVNNGTSNSSSGYQISMGPYWKFYKSFFASFDFSYLTHSGNFKAPDVAQGSRADVVEGAKSSDSIMGLFVGLGMNL